MSTNEPLELFAGVVPFFHVAEQRSFRRAADELGVTTAAISKAVSRLEERLGVKLLSRSSRVVALTPEGTILHARARDAIASIRAGHDQLTRSRAQPRGEVRVSTSFILGPILVRALPQLAARYPELVVHVELSDKLSGLVGGDVDVALRIGAREASSLVSRVLYRPRWVTVASPAFLARHGTPSKPADLAAFRCVRFFDPRHRAPPWWFGTPPAPLDVDGNVTVTDGNLLVDAAVAGAGIAQLMDFMIGDRIRTGELVEVLAAHATEAPPIHAVTAPDRARSANVRAILELAAATFARLGPSA